MLAINLAVNTNLGHDGTFSGVLHANAYPFEKTTQLTLHQINMI